jgi:hypothetical protein
MSTDDDGRVAVGFAEIAGELGLAEGVDSRAVRFATVPLQVSRAGGVLAFRGPYLVAVLSLLDSGAWFLELGIGPCDAAPLGKVFDDLPDVAAWIEARYAASPSLDRANV